METNKIMVDILVLISFYPTYKEWKLDIDFTGQLSDPSFYPTYKEWKPF